MRFTHVNCTPSGHRQITPVLPHESDLTALALQPRKARRGGLAVTQGSPRFVPHYLPLTKTLKVLSPVEPFVAANAPGTTRNTQTVRDCPATSHGIGSPTRSRLALPAAPAASRPTSTWLSLPVFWLTVQLNCRPTTGRAPKDLPALVSSI